MSNDQAQHVAIVSVGTNIDPEINLQKSMSILKSETHFLGEASVIQTEPDGFKDQPDFLSGAYLLGTDLSYEDFNQYLKQVENRMGRIKGPIKSGPRCIDLDIIIWDGKIVHDDYHQQKHYVIQPVNELLDAHGIQIN